MNKIFKLTFAFLIGFTFFSCSEENIESHQDNTQNLEFLANKITLDSSSKEVTSFFFKLGISEINFSKNDSGVKVKSDSSKSFNFRGQKINFSDYSVEIGTKLITLKQDNRYKIGLMNNKAYIISPSFEGYYEDADLNTLYDVKNFILVAYLNELTYNEKKSKIDTNKAVNYKAGCSFLDQGFSVGVGLNETSAKADLESSMEADISEGETEGCTKVGEPESVAWTNETVWVQTWCCE